MLKRAPDLEQSNRNIFVILLSVTDTGSGAHYLDISSLGFSDVPTIVAVRHRAFAKVADDLDIFVVVEAKFPVGTDLVVIENDEIPDRRVGRIARKVPGRSDVLL